MKKQPPPPLTGDQIEEIIQMSVGRAREIAGSETHAPMAIVIGPQIIFPMQGDFRTEADKERFCAMVRGVSRLSNAKAVVFVTEAWITVLGGKPGIPTEAEALADLQKARESGVPRQEVLMVSIEVRGEKTRMMTANIGEEGGEGARKVGPWTTFDSMQASGRMIDLLGEFQENRFQA